LLIKWIIKLIKVTPTFFRNAKKKKQNLKRHVRQIKGVNRGGGGGEESQRGKR